MKISSLYPFNDALPHYFNSLNKDGWFYYQEEQRKKDFLKLNLHSKNSENIYFDYVVKEYMNQHLNSTAPRKEIYAQSMQLIKKNFFFGNGNNFSFILTKTEKLPVVTKGNAESDFLQYLLEMGFFGFLLKITIYLSLLFNKKINKESYMIVIMGTFFLISLDLFLTTSQYYYYWIFLTSILSTSFLKKKNFK
jgi:O-antigen ligase